MRLIGRRPERQRPSPMLRRLLEARTNTPQARRPLSPTRIRRALHRDVSPQQRCAPAKDRAQSGAVRRTRVRQGAAGAGLDRGARLTVAPDRVTPVPGGGLDSGADRRVPGRGRSRPALPALAPRRPPRATPRRGGPLDLGRRRPRRGAGNRARALRRNGSVVTQERVGQPDHRARRAHRRGTWSPRTIRTPSGDCGGRRGVDSGRVFTREAGSQLNPDSVSQRFDRLVARHALPPIRLHDLRHGAATLALAAGAGAGAGAKVVLPRARPHLHPDHPRPLHQRATAGLQGCGSHCRCAPRAQHGIGCFEGSGPTRRTACTGIAHTWGQTDIRKGGGFDKAAGQIRWGRWGGWGSNPRPKDYEGDRAESQRRWATLNGDESRSTEGVRRPATSEVFEWFSIGVRTVCGLLAVVRTSPVPR